MEAEGQEKSDDGQSDSLAVASSAASSHQGGLLRHATFFRAHLSYFVGLILLSTLFLLAAEKLSFMDGLYMGTSACTVTGLLATDISTWSSGSQFLLILFSLVGSVVFTSILPPLIRLLTLRSQLKGVALEDPETQMGVHTEYVALQKLVMVPLIYAASVQGIGVLLLGLYFQFSPVGNAPLVNHGINPWWFAFFHTFSAFSNSGFGLLPDSLREVNQQPFPLLILGFLVVLGNTGFPVLLRLILWIRVSYFPTRDGTASYDLLLAHPRRNFTHLFGAVQTWWLLLILITFTVVEWGFFLALDWRSSALEGLGVGSKILNGWFQAVSTRSSGFTTVNVANLAVAMQVLYLGAMYLTAYPVAISIRNSETEARVYSYQRLNEPLEDSTMSYQAKRMAMRDILWLFIAFFVLCISEGSKIKQDPLNYGPFRILFELASAYGNVGLSLGYHNTAVSFSAVWNPFSKFILCLVMFMGRHRSLPDSIDPAVDLTNLARPVDAIVARPVTAGDSTTSREYQLENLQQQSPSRAPRKRSSPDSTLRSPDSYFFFA